MSALSAFALLFAAVTAGQVAPQQERPSTSGADAALVSELRALRESVERFLTANVRVQLLMGRLQLQEARIQTIGRQATDLDGQMLQLSRERDELTQQQSAMERMSRQAPDAEEREEFRRQAAALGGRVKQIEARLAALGTDLASVQQALATEQNRWGEFNDRLEELERELRRP
jgi:chromosome segregation ATPase